MEQRIQAHLKRKYGHLLPQDVEFQPGSVIHDGFWYGFWIGKMRARLAHLFGPDGRACQICTEAQDYEYVFKPSCRKTLALLADCI